MTSIMSTLKEWEKKRGKLNYDIDGIVIKVNSLEAQNLLGETSKVPKYDSDLYSANV
jgi:DNA ligase (NAD+)